MGGFISNFTQRMENVAQLSIDEAFTKQNIDFGRSGLIERKGEFVIGKHQIYDCFTDHAQFHQTRIGI